MPLNLQHIGILGMRWGVHTDESGNSGKTKRQSSADHVGVSASRKKQLHELSNAEMKAVTNRIKLEKEYKEVNPNLFKKGKNIVDGLTVLNSTIIAAATLGAAAVKYKPHIEKFINSYAKG